MGLIQAIGSAAAGSLADQWKEFFYCDALNRTDTLMVRGQKKLGNAHPGSNTRGDDNIISNGSTIAVADGQCMLIVEQGKVVELCAQPGEFTWDSSTEPSIFCRQPRRGHSEYLQADRQEIHVRRNDRQGSESLLHQYQGTAGQQVRHRQSGPVPCCRPERRHRPRYFRPLLRRIFL
jgi:membrane protease subunit (stomatin/prohibitin family)